MQQSPNTALRFISNDHISFKNGRKVSGHRYNEWREVRIHKAIGHVYRVSICKLRPGRVSPVGKVLPATPMLLTDASPACLHFAAEEHAIEVLLHDQRIREVRWTHQQLTCAYLKAPDRHTEKQIDIPLTAHLQHLADEDRDGLIDRYRQIITTVESSADSVYAVAAYYLFLGKVQFKRGAYREAREALTQVNMGLIFNGRTPLHEATYWFARVCDAEGHFSEAVAFYRHALQQCHVAAASRSFILDAIGRIHCI